MRSETEMLALIIGVAKEDDRIKAVVMNGSRVLPNVPKDQYQDYDIIYYVTDVRPFVNNLEWIEEKFGKPVLMQIPKNIVLIPSKDDGNFTYLMIFEDGNRIDLTISLLSNLDDQEPAIILLDKDGILPSLQDPSDKCYHIKKPTYKIFTDCCNEFWWCLNNVGKGLARDELPYVMKMFNTYVREMLEEMLKYYIGINYDFSVSTGKFNKYFKKYLPDELYITYLETYANASCTSIWKAVFKACDLFHLAALYVAKHFNYPYNQAEEDALRSYLKTIKASLNNKV